MKSTMRIKPVFLHINNFCILVLLLVIGLSWVEQYNPNIIVFINAIIEFDFLASYKGDNFPDPENFIN